jgi:hypothetical protein
LLKVIKREVQEVLNVAELDKEILFILDQLIKVEVHFGLE